MDFIKDATLRWSRFITYYMYYKSYKSCINMIVQCHDIVHTSQRKGLSYNDYW